MYFVMTEIAIEEEIDCCRTYYHAFKTFDI